MKTRHDNDMTDHTGFVYSKTEKELLGPIWLSAVYDENQIGQQPNRSYKYDLCWKRNWVIVTD